MTQREKYFVFGIGFLVGCVVLWLFFYKKEGISFTPRSETEVKPWYGRIYFEKTTPSASTAGQPLTRFERIRIIDDGSGKKVRLHEIIEKDEQTKKRERILQRQVMADDVVWIRFINSQAAQEAVQWLKDSQCQYEAINDVLFRVTVPCQEGHDSVEEMIQASQQHSQWVRYAFPQYLLHYG